MGNRGLMREVDYILTYHWGVDPQEDVLKMLHEAGWPCDQRKAATRVARLRKRGVAIPGDYRVLLREARDTQLVNLDAAGLSDYEIAERMGITLAALRMRRLRLGIPSTYQTLRAAERGMSKAFSSIPAYAGKLTPCMLDAVAAVMDDMGLEPDELIAYAVCLMSELVGEDKSVVEKYWLTPKTDTQT